MHNITSATLSFGFVNVPVKVCSLASRKETHLRQLHVNCTQPIKKIDRCEMCDTILTRDDIVSGVEVAKGQFTVIDTDKLASYATPKSAIIQVKKFVPSYDLDATLIEKSYWLGHTKFLESQYELLVAGMEAEDVVAIGHASLWRKEYPIAVSVMGGALCLSVLFCADEVVSNQEITDALTVVETTQEELDFVSQFISLKRSRITTEDLSSLSRIRQEEFIAATVEGRTLSIEAAVAMEPTTDMMTALRESVEQAQKERVNA